jgi:adenine-specific DNA methylase
MGDVSRTTSLKKSMIEKWIPIRELSRDAAIEMSFKPTPAYIARCKELKITHEGRSFYDPKIRSLHPWLARRSRSVARALNLAALLPFDTSADGFLSYLGFSREKLLQVTSKSYPPLISYLSPNLSSITIPKDAVILDPMAGGGSIPLESAILGINTIACDYNPVAYLLLRATVEFPAKYGLELWKRLVKEVKALLSYASNKLSPHYETGIEGYIILRQVKLNDKVIPLQTIVPLSKDVFVKVKEDGSLSFIKHKEKGVTRRRLLKTWMEQHVNAMKGDLRYYEITHKCIAVQTQKGFRLANGADKELLLKAYSDYLSKFNSISLPSIDIPKDNEVFSDILPLRQYNMLFSPRQALALDILISYARSRIQELIGKEGEFGAALGLYLALGIDRVADFNSIITSWNYNTLTIRDGIGSYYKFRKFRLEGIYAEAIVPYRTLNWIYEPECNDRTAGGICPVIKELAEKLEDKKCQIETYMCDAAKLSQHFKNIADVINVDPPYYDQHMYGDFSEFFWPILKTVLEPAIPILFDKRVLIDWAPENWVVPKSNEIIARDSNKRSFEVRLEAALKEMRAALKDDGLLVFWFSHRNMDAWKAAIEALGEAGFSITSIIPIPSEHPTRSITRGGQAGINRVLIIVARKKETVKERDQAEILKRFKDYILESKLYPGEIIPEEELRLLTKAAAYALSKC